ncbi:MAG: ferrous iron transport protein A [Desulfobacteraceae bacterium]
MEDTIPLTVKCSSLKKGRFSRSVLTTNKPKTRAGIFALRLARESDQVRIVSMKEGKRFRDRLAGLGLRVGAHVQVIQNNMNGKLLIDHEGVRLFLGGGMANKIQVVVINEGGN